MRNIVICGGGFGGLTAAGVLEDELGPRRHLQITLVTDNAHFVFTPLLPGVTSGEVGLPSISVSLRDHLRSRTRVQIDRVEAVDLDAREVIGAGRRYPFDYLILAPGAVTDWRGHAEWQDFVTPLKAGTDAVWIREQVRDAFALADDEAGQRPPRQEPQESTSA